MTTLIELTGDWLNLTSVGNKRVGVNANAPTCALDVSSTESGIGFPTLTQAQINSISSNRNQRGATTNNITIDTEGSETIDGASSVSITTNYGSVTLASNGTNLFTI